MRGIDVSTFQGYPDWSKVKASGIDFAIIKATQGRAESSNSYMFTDGKFVYNITNATKAGVPCGVYHYLTARTPVEVKAEAEYYLGVIEPYRSMISLYVAVDVESYHITNAGLSKQTVTDLVVLFCDMIRSAGYVPIVYTNPDWLKTKLNGIGSNKLWLALWRDKSNVPSGYGDMKIWQWGGEAVPGIAGTVDSNFGYFEITDEEAEQIIKPPVVLDNTPDSWAANAVMWAAANKLISGDENSNYKLHESITRQEMLVILHRYNSMK